MIATAYYAARSSSPFFADTESLQEFYILLYNKRLLWSALDEISFFSEMHAFLLASQVFLQQN